MNEKKVDRHTCLQVNGSAVGCKIYGVYVLKPTNKVFFDVLAECDSISEANYRHQRISHDIRHQITYTGPLMRIKSRSLPLDNVKIAKREFERMMHLSIVRQTSSPWASPLHLVPMEDQD